MVPAPVPFGLVLCEKIIVEEGSQRVTFVNSFTKLAVPEFPSPPQSFHVFAALTGGRGHGIMRVEIQRMDTLAEIYNRSRPVHFLDRSTELQVAFWLNDCSFPEPGRYQVILLVDGD